MSRIASRLITQLCIIACVGIASAETQVGSAVPEPLLPIQAILDLKLGIDQGQMLKLRPTLLGGPLSRSLEPEKFQFTPEEMLGVHSMSADTNELLPGSTIIEEYHFGNRLKAAKGSGFKSVGGFIRDSNGNVGLERNENGDIIPLPASDMLGIGLTGFNLTVKLQTEEDCVGVYRDLVTYLRATNYVCDIVLAKEDSRRRGDIIRVFLSTKEDTRILDFNIGFSLPGQEPSYFVGIIALSRPDFEDVRTRLGEAFGKPERPRDLFAKYGLESVFDSCGKQPSEVE